MMKVLICFLLWTTAVSSFVTTPKHSSSHLVLHAEEPEILPVPTSQVVTKVAVAGATGKTGSYVVKELLKRNVQVKGLVRNLDKAKTTFGSVPGLEVVECDLSNAQDIEKSLKGCDAVIWCATGFSDAEPDFMEKIKKLLGMVMTKPKQQSIDAVGIPAVSNFIKKGGASSSTNFPKVVMLSSAGVTRPSWDEAKKEQFPGSANIPIVRLNPFGILGIKADSEEKLRQSGVNYCIVRPGGLNDEWPAGSRPILSQGDLAVGRICRQDVATLLVDVLSAEEASGKTFEVIAVADYAPPRNLAPALNRLKLDKEGLPSMQELHITYGIMQQLLPGERQDAAALAMGQTYEQLDKGETGRLGERGKENAEAAAPKPTSK